MGKLTIADKIVVVAGFVLVSALFMPWYRLTAGVGSVSIPPFDAGPLRGLLALLVLLVTIAVMALVVLPKVSEVKLPHLPVGGQDEVLFGSIAAAASTVALLLLKRGGYGWGFGALVGLIAAAGLVFGALQHRGEAKASVPIDVPGNEPPPPSPPRKA